MTEPNYSPSIAYLSMEIGLAPDIPTYSGGLGVLAGDSLRAAADLSLPMVGVSLVHRRGYFRQELDESGRQTEVPDAWSPEDQLEELPQRVSVLVEGRDVHLRAWRYMVEGTPGNEHARPIPVYLLDANLPENDPRDQGLTNELYGGDQRYRLSQEVLLGIGGIALLRALGIRDIRTYHMNEGHSGLLVLALLEELRNGRDGDVSEQDMEAVRRRCVFTVHTPVPAGHDTFPVDITAEVLGPERLQLLEATNAIEDGMFDLTAYVMAFSRSANGVSMRHAQISRDMFPEHRVGAVTNGVHAGTWVSEPFARLFDRYIPDWRRDTRYFRYAMGVPLDDVRQAHLDAKKALIDEVTRRNGVELDPHALTIGFARRATGYKRGDLLFSDLDRLRRMVDRIGPIQVIFSGKAHPRDDTGKHIIQQIFTAAKELGDTVKVTYLADYDMTIGKVLTAGVDIWLNNPQKPLEASGTSGMKAAMNGVPSLSVLDGWWIEGHVEGVTGWAIGDQNPADERTEITSLYDKLEYVIMPMYYRQPHAFAAVMRYAIALNGEFFSAQRMMNQYYRDVYEDNGETVLG
jgi:glycogen phosphorylase